MPQSIQPISRPIRLQRGAFAATVFVVTFFSALTPLRDSPPLAQTTGVGVSGPEVRAEQPDPVELDQLIAQLETALQQINTVLSATERRSTDLLEKIASAGSIEESSKYQQLYTETMVKLDELVSLQRGFEIEINRLKQARQTIGKSKPK